MNWRLKCLAFHLLEIAPMGKNLHSILQKRVTGRYYQKLTPNELSAYSFHTENFMSFTPSGVALEFGAGRNLLTPLLLSRAGASRIHAFDLTRLATLEQVNDVILQLRNLLPGDWPTVASLEELLPAYRIQYHAPGDARNTGLADKSVDFVYSTSTLEHIPATEIRQILSECKRLLSPQGVMSFIIDYHDHFGTADRNITRWNFYRYSRRAWNKYNPSNHYQNRLRHSDHEALFAGMDLVVDLERRTIPDWAESELLRTAIAPDFARYSRQDLLTSNGHFILRSAAVA